MPRRSSAAVGLLAVAGGAAERNSRLSLQPKVQFWSHLETLDFSSRAHLATIYASAHVDTGSGVRPSANARSSLRSQRDVRAPRKRPSWRPCSSRLTHTAPCTRQLRAEAREPLRTSRAPSSMPDTALHVRYGARCPIRRCVLLLSRDTPETAPSSPKPRREEALRVGDDADGHVGREGGEHVVRLLLEALHRGRGEERV